MKRTQLSFEVPLAHLQDFDEDQDFVFGLSFLTDNPSYRKYLANTTKELWIDNSSNELKVPDSPDLLASLYKAFQPARVVSPDHPDWGIEQTLHHWQKCVDAGVPADRLVCVIHHPDWIGHYKSYGAQHFAVPYDFRYCTRHKLKRFSQAHFLGLLSVQELLVAKPPSCDTAMPIKLALAGKTLSAWIEEGCPHMHTLPDFFHLKMTAEQIDLAKRNIADLKARLVQDDPVNHPRHYTQGTIEVLDFILDQKLDYLPGQVVKYMCRYKYKGGLTDLLKAQYYLRRLIDEYESDNTE